MGLSILFIPTFILFPHKVSLLVNLGALCIIASFGALKGFSNFFWNDLMAGDRKWVSLIYLSAVVLNVYASAIAKSYILTMVTLAVVVLYVLKMMKQLLWFW